MMTIFFMMDFLVGVFLLWRAPKLRKTMSLSCLFSYLQAALNHVSVFNCNHVYHDSDEFGKADATVSAILMVAHKFGSGIEIEPDIELAGNIRPHFEFEPEQRLVYAIR